MSWLCKELDQTCTKRLAAPAGRPPLPKEGIRLRSSVGQGGKNFPEDVKSIQDALNAIVPADGGAAPPLVPDGVCGTKTKQAITAFQVRHFGWSKADAKVDLFGRTHVKLSELTGKPVPTPNQGLVDGMLAHLGLARSFIGAAKFQCERALAMVDQPDTRTPISAFDRSAVMELANRHFHIDNYPTFQRRDRLKFAHRIFLRMDQVFERPGGLWGVQSFAPDPTLDTGYAYTLAGGFFRGGQIDTTPPNIRMDTIYFCTKAFASVGMPDFAAHIIVHEMAHFVGNPEVDIIDDHTYGSANKCDRVLSLTQKLHNADSYANFAREAFLGTRQRPSWQTD